MSRTAVTSPFWKTGTTISLREADEQAIKLLSSLEQSDWYQNWTKESIIKALNDYREKKADQIANNN